MEKEGQDVKRVVSMLGSLCNTWFGLILISSRLCSTTCKYVSWICHYCGYLSIGRLGGVTASASLTRGPLILCHCSIRLDVMRNKHHYYFVFACGPAGGWNDGSRHLDTKIKVLYRLYFKVDFDVKHVISLVCLSILSNSSTRKRSKAMQGLKEITAFGPLSFFIGWLHM